MLNKWLRALDKMKKQLIKLALLLAPFFSQANIFNDGTVLTVPPDRDTYIEYRCMYGGAYLGQTTDLSSCISLATTKAQAAATESGLEDCGSGLDLLQTNDQFSASVYYYVKHMAPDGAGGEYCKRSSHGDRSVTIVSPQETESVVCPPELQPTYTFPVFNDEGEIEKCADPSNIEVNDSCNHSPTHDAMSNYLINATVTSQSICAALPDGSMCRYSAVDVGVGGQVYQYDYEADSCYETPDIDLVEIPNVQLPSYNESMGDFQCIQDGGLLACSETPENVVDENGNAPDGCGNINGTYGCYSTDTDNDTLPDYLDPDIDGDGIRNEDDLDADGDGVDDVDRGDSSGSGSDSGSGSTVNVELDLEPVVNELKKINETNVETKTEPNLEQESFWESDYEDGFQGMFEGKVEEIKATALFSFIDKFQPNISGGSPANYNFCFNLGAMGNFGCHDLGIDARVIPAIKILILISAAFACRRIIFGG